MPVFSEQSVAQDIGIALRDIESNLRHYASLNIDLWVNRSATCLQGMLPAYIFLRSRDDVHLTQQCIKFNFDLSVVEDFAWDEAASWRGELVREKGYFEGFYGRGWCDAIKPLQSYIKSIPGYDVNLRGRQSLQAKDQYQFTVQQLARLWCDRQRDIESRFTDSLPEANATDRIVMLEICRKGSIENEISDHCGEVLCSCGHRTSAGRVQ